MIPWEHDCKRCLYNTEPKANACAECIIDALPDGAVKDVCKENIELIVGDEDDRTGQRPNP